jgi:hypothetical protein
MKRGIKTLIYGASGIGKMNLVNSLRVSKKIISLEYSEAKDLQSGTPTNLLQGVSQALREASKSKPELVVITPVSVMESFIFRDLVSQSSVKSIEHVDGGYGKGYVRAKEKWETIFGWMNDKLLAEGVSVALIASAESHEYKNPFGLSYATFGVQVNRHAAALFEVEMDNIFFMSPAGLFNPELMGVSVHTTQSVAYTAKNCLGLTGSITPEELSGKLSEAIVMGRLGTV